MTLPVVSGWVIDFRTARAIFASGSNERISHCIGLCGAGHLHICHCEEKNFRSVAALKAAFVDDQNCVWLPDDDILERSLAISATPIAQARISGNESAVFLAAIAAANDFGVISDHRSVSLSTVFDICGAFGIPILSADEYFDAL